MDRSFWKTHYVVHGDADEIARRVRIRTFSSGPDTLELLCFEEGSDLPNVVISLGSPLKELRIPTMFVVASGGPTPGYISDLYDGLPEIKKRLTIVNGSVYWMLSHPVEAADLVCGWFDETLRKAQ